jgi:hypothetical protein
LTDDWPVLPQAGRPAVEIDPDAAAATRRAKDRDEVTAVWVGTADEPELAEFKAEVGYRR